MMFSPFIFLLWGKWDPHTCCVSIDFDTISPLSHSSFLCRVFYLASTNPHIWPEHIFWLTANQSLQDQINVAKAHIYTATKKSRSIRAGRDLRVFQLKIVLWARRVLKFFFQRAYGGRAKQKSGFSLKSCFTFMFGLDVWKEQSSLFFFFFFP